ncbi:MAG: hypothetical protein L0Z50_41965, partial [Verrucomicrobiales bacterium]|nr:hypothetical protein [Verrucomicrobiales bacterium]
VEPQVENPKELFAQSPVEIVAAFFPNRTPVYFPRNPVDHPWQEENWNVWYAPSREDAFLSNLHTFLGHQGYLIYSASDFVLKVTGRADYKPIRWQPDSLNFVGFGLDPQAPPTFQKFFAGSKAHHERRIFRLEEGRWALLRDPANTRMRAGEACWVECFGASDYQGPVTVKLPMSNALEFPKANRGGSRAPARLRRLPFTRRTAQRSTICKALRTCYPTVGITWPPFIPARKSCLTWTESRRPLCRTPPRSR